MRLPDAVVVSLLVRIPDRLGVLTARWRTKRPGAQPQPLLSLSDAHLAAAGRALPRRLRRRP